MREESGYLLDPHTACAAIAARTALADTKGPRIVLATAHPAKFPDAVEAITGERAPLPPRLAALLAAPERITVLPNDLAAVQGFVAGRSGAGRGAVA
jgi:threonine synthase